MHAHIHIRCIQKMKFQKDVQAHFFLPISEKNSKLNPIVKL